MRLLPLSLGIVLLGLAMAQAPHDLKLRGNNAATLLITPIANRATAILAQRVSP